MSGMSKLGQAGIILLKWMPDWHEMSVNVGG
jgi:hypothetical protein